MTLTEIGTNTIVGIRYDSTITLPITDSTTITKGNFVEVSSGKLIKAVTSLSTNLVGMAVTTQTMGVLATAGEQQYVGVCTEGIVKVKGLVEGSGGTYTNALAVGDKVSFYYDATSGYGQFVVKETTGAIGIVVSGSVAASGGTADQWDYVWVQLDFEAEAVLAGTVADLAITTGKLANGSVKGTKIATGGITSSASLATGVVSSAKIAVGAVTSTRVAVGGIEATNIAVGAVESTNIGVGAVEGTHVGVGAIESTNIAVGGVLPTNIDVTVPVSAINPTIRYTVDGGDYELNATLGTLTQGFTNTLSTTVGAIVLLTPGAEATIQPYYGSMTVTSFLITGDGGEAGSWAAFVRV